MISLTIQNTIEKALKALNIELLNIHLEHPQDPSHGDFSTNIALILAKKLGKNPQELALTIAEEANKDLPAEIETIGTAGPGFINIFLSKEFFSNTLEEMFLDGETYGDQTIGEGKTVIVEFSSPNIAKPFTIGHFRSTIIGDSLTRILKTLGYKVVADNHLGDWGTQFGKLTYALKTWGDEGAIEKSIDPVKSLVELYIKFHDEAEKNPALDEEGRAWFVRLEQGDVEARRVWKRCIDWSMIEFNRLYKRLGINFDTMLGESFFEDKMATVISDIDKAGIAKESEGAYLVFFPEDKIPPLMVRKSDGSTLYATRDLATDKYRVDTYGKDVVIVNEVGSEQTLYFKQLFEVEEMLGYIPKDQRVHVKHGLYRFKDGKMSTRKGNVIWLNDILEEAVSEAGKINPESAEEVGIGAVKFNDLKRESSQDIVFDWKEVLNLKGDSGPYLQYSAARAHAVLEKARQMGISAQIKEGEEVTVPEKLLYRFPQVIARAGAHFSPHYIATYLIEVASSFNNFYSHNQVVDEDDKETSAHRVAITEATANVLSKGLSLLGIATPKKM